MERMDGGTYKALSLTERRASTIDSTDGELSPTRSKLQLVTSNNRLTQRIENIVPQHPRGPPTPNMNTPSAELDDGSQSGHDILRPPTPAESPRPDHVSQLDWSTAGDQEDSHLASMRAYFMVASGPARKRLLGELLNVCTSEQLSFVNQFVSPLLKKDPFTSLPDELCLRVCCKSATNIPFC